METLINKRRQIDYNQILESLKIEYQEDDYYIRVGTPVVTQGWILHITVVIKNGAELITEVVPLLLDHNAPFKIIKNSSLHRKINDGDFGKNKVGKIVTVFLDNPTTIETLTRKLISATRKYNGPKVFTDLPIQNVIFTRYGSFVNMIDIDSFGNKVRLLKDQNENLILDNYYSPPVIPSWVDNPFLPFIDIFNKEKKSKIIENKILLLKLLKEDVKGNVWKGLYLSKTLIPMLCIVKQGRIGIFPDENGRDARDRLRWQYHLNQALEKKN